MNLYSQKVNDQSIASVETETAVAKETKRKIGGKKAKKETVAAPEPNQVVPEVESKQTDEAFVQELEAMSDIEPNSVAETESTQESEPIVDPVEVKKPKRQRTVSKKVTPPAPPPTPEPVIDDDEPPKWFMNYVSNMKSFQNEVAEKKKPKRVLKNESDDYAKEQWKKPGLRQKVTDSVDSHLTKMYRQIFSNRG